MPNDHQVELSNSAIVLRALSVGDAETVCQAVRESLTELRRWLSWCHADYGLHDTLEFLRGRGEAFRRDGEHNFGIFERSSGRFVGGVGINQRDQTALRANLGYWLRTSATGRGYATEAVQLVARWALETLGLERIEIVAATGNEASQRVAVRAGAVREGIARRRLRVHGVQHDAVVFSLTLADLRNEAGPLNWK